VYSRIPFIVAKPDMALDVPSLTRLIIDTQRPDGEIPWSPGDKTDPWDHVEAAMGLTIGGAYPHARRAFEWLRWTQLDDGSWYAAYRNGTVVDATRQTHHAAYIAVGLYHYYLVTADSAYVQHMWSTLDAAMEFALRYQTDEGEIYWALNPQGRVDPMALLSGCSSIYMSLRCALALARVTKRSRPRWRRALSRLETCIRHRPQRFNMTKSRFSMDWFYPVLCGAITGHAASQRIYKYWKKFVIHNMGVRCVSDQPWVTIAESSELVLALCAMGNRLLARIVYSWISDHKFDDGTFWCGFTFPDMVLWPEEKITWTNAVILMATDALFDLTPAGRLFHHQFWSTGND
jgi:hypothetical protein